MKRLLLFFLTFSMLYTSCNKDDGSNLNQKAEVTTTSRFYGVKYPDMVTTRGIAQKDKLWHNGTTLKIKFLNGSHEYHDKVRTYAAEWEKYANIQFEFVENEKANVRIGFDWNNDQYITWSYIGNDCMYVRNQNVATANFAYWNSSQEHEIKGDVLRLFGQILGLELEHRHLNFDAEWTDGIEEYWTGEIEDIPWSDLKELVFDPLSGDNIIQTREYDENSIMIWPFTRKYAKNTARDFNYELSNADKLFMAQLYPKNNQIEGDLTTFKFIVNPNDSYTINFTEVLQTPHWIELFQDGISIFEGAGTEAPTVTLYDGTYIFKIKGEQYSFLAPTRNGIVNFHFGDAIFDEISFFGSSILQNLSCNIPPRIMASHMQHTFYWCGNLKAIPNGFFDNCPHVTEFSFTFAQCKSLTEIPEDLFRNCTELEKLHRVFNYCSNLKSIPAKLFENNINFKYSSSVFSGCSGITDIPADLFVNNINLIDFSGTFEDCSALTSIPTGLFDKNTNVTDFSSTFRNCSNITSKVPELWKTHPNATGRICFAGCTKAENYASVNSKWK